MASEKLAAQTLNADAKLVEDEAGGAVVVAVDGADVSGGQRSSLN